MTTAIKKIEELLGKKTTTNLSEFIDLASFKEDDQSLLLSIKKQCADKLHTHIDILHTYIYPEADPFQAHDAECFLESEKEEISSLLTRCIILYKESQILEIKLSEKETKEFIEKFVGLCVTSHTAIIGFIQKTKKSYQNEKVVSSKRQSTNYLG